MLATMKVIVAESLGAHVFFVPTKNFSTAITPKHYHSTSAVIGVFFA
jgi:PDZ domain-containing secreted protein